LVLDRINLKGGLEILHFAPEPFFRQRLAVGAKRYETADIDRPDVDHLVDIQKLPFSDASFDLVYASHVMEHIQDESRGLIEVARVLRPGGMAILPVPIVREVTEEYDEPNPDETMHWRAPGKDYFDRLRAVFSQVDVFDSHMFDERFQPFVIEPDKRVSDYVPVCRV